jgi:glycosyltransferase involved in cell wall biosynthesis
MIKFSIITVCLNAEKTIESTINSVLNQSYSNIQYIIIDGLSNDNTMNIVYKYQDKISKIISEPDNGLYDAINKGIQLSEGNIVGILNSDDIFHSNSTIFNIANCFEADKDIMCLIGDVAFLNENKRISRVYSSKFWTPFLFRFGFMPPHPSFYCRKELFLKYGIYRTDFRIAADFELILRFLRIHKLHYHKIREIIVLMKIGGLSTQGWSSQKVISKEILKACKLNEIYTNYFFIYLRYLLKAIQFFPH